MEKRIRKNNSFVTYFKENASILVFLIAICVVMSFLSPHFATTDNLINILRSSSTNIILACGMTCVILLGGIDISVGSIMAMSGVLCAVLISWNHMPIPMAVLIGILGGFCIGLFNAYMTANTTIPAFIVTLATMNIARGIAYVMTDGQPVQIVSDSFNFIGSGYLFGCIPMPVIYFVVIFAVTFIILNKTKTGRYIYATGGNIEAARFAGIKTKKIVFAVYAFSGLLASIAGIVLASRMYSGQPTAGNGAEMDAIAAVVLGGTSMLGGVGKIGGTIIGAFIIGVINNMLDLLNVNSFYQYIVKGFIILLAVYIDFMRKNKAKE